MLTDEIDYDYSCLCYYCCHRNWEIPKVKCFKYFQYYKNYFSNETGLTYIRKKHQKHSKITNQKI